VNRLCSLKSKWPGDFNVTLLPNEVLLATVFLAAFGLAPRTQCQTLSDALTAARYSLRVDDSGFSGTGAHVLTQALDDAQFVAIGEDHLTREIPRFAAAVCDEMAPRGLGAMALETSPAAAQFVESTFGASDRAARMADLERKFPDSIAFLSDRQENDLAEHCVEAAKGNDFHLWGLDQEFLGSAGWILQRMIETDPGPKAMAAIRSMQKDQQEGAAEAAHTGDLSKLYLLSSTDAQIAAARTAILSDGRPLTRQIFAQLTESRSLYQEHALDFRSSNARRATLLKQNFLKNYRAAKATRGAPPRVLVKFGDTHLYRGLNELHEGNLGNFLSELADVTGSRSLQIMVLGVAGEHATYSNYGQPFKHSAFVLDEDDNYKWLAPAVATRKDVSADGPWTLYDLRQLRFGRVARLDPSWERVAYGYDLLVLIPEITPAELLR
jgi:hypothetical protein